MTRMWLLRILLELRLWQCLLILSYTQEFLYDYLYSYQKFIHLPHRIYSCLQWGRNSWSIFGFGCLCCWLMMPRSLFLVIRCLQQRGRRIVGSSLVVESFWRFLGFSTFGIHLVSALDCFVVAFGIHFLCQLVKGSTYFFPNFLLSIGRCLSLYQ
jgi:hypothetical protein